MKYYDARWCINGRCKILSEQMVKLENSEVFQGEFSEIKMGSFNDQGRIFNFTNLASKMNISVISAGRDLRIKK